MPPPTIPPPASRIGTNFLSLSMAAQQTTARQTESGRSCPVTLMRDTTPTHCHPYTTCPD